MRLFGQRRYSQRNKYKRPLTLAELTKKAATSLAMNNISVAEAEVYLVLDYSAGPTRYYDDGTMQTFLEQVLAIALNTNENASLTVTLFNHSSYEPFIVTPDNYKTILSEDTRPGGRLGIMSYGPSMERIYLNHQESGIDKPALVICQTNDLLYGLASSMFTFRSSKQPFFWQFVGLGMNYDGAVDHLDYLAKLNGQEIKQASAAPRNSSFFDVGIDPQSIDPEVGCCGDFRIGSEMLGHRASFADTITIDKPQKIVREVQRHSMTWTG